MGTIETCGGRTRRHQPRDSAIYCGHWLRSRIRGLTPPDSPWLVVNSDDFRDRKVVIRPVRIHTARGFAHLGKLR